MLALGFAALALLTAGLVLSLQAQELTQHQTRKDTDKGPRALGLVQISDKGKARIIPVAIMINGKFFDAESYKADPVPMALDFGIVYEGFKAGVSQGLFTITQPGQLNREWIAEGTWLPEGARPKTDRQKYTPPVIDLGGKDDDRPVLHRRQGGEADKDDSKPAGTSGSSVPAGTTSASSSPSSPSSPAPTSGASTSGTSTPSSSGAPQTSASTSPPTLSPKDSDKSAKAPEASTAKSSDSATSKASDTAPPKSSESASRGEYDQPINDPNRPVLRRGKPDASAHHEPFVNFDNPDEMAAASKEAGKEGASVQASAAASFQTIAAISDAAGPDPRPYTYDLKPAEEAIYRNKMLELASQQLNPKSSKVAEKPATKSTAAKKTAKPEKPQLEDVKLRIFDLSNSNEPVLVLSARTPVPAATASGSQVPQEITLIARTNLEGELQKLYFAQTDSRHLDLRPRMELVDAVDADGDGRGELLFRRTFESGSAYAIYRVSADQLWPLWEPTP